MYSCDRVPSPAPRWARKPEPLARPTRPAGVTIRFRFDTGGDTQTVLINARILNINLHDVEDVIVAHNHDALTFGHETPRATCLETNPNSFKTAYAGAPVPRPPLRLAHRREPLFRQRADQRERRHRSGPDVHRAEDVLRDTFPFAINLPIHPGWQIQLQWLTCASKPPAASCKAPISARNYCLVKSVGPAAGM